MRAEPPPPPRPDRQRAAPRQSLPLHHRRCPYLEQILREPAGPFGLLTRYKADCHVDHATYTFTGRHPTPPCSTEQSSCPLYLQQRGDEDRLISRYTD